ncbi:tRNA(ANN) t(6)A37 threonylcarbamoyladenosine modification protein [Porphyromonas macacae]|uniref:L-threonylcarbamoyladenylate synthase n=3 Tax=Porphyromonas macacae TaxID=28115 RepID=A0A379DFK6_9PORP|nr:tRNA(ANN) t(6)A37 threonylcarbamoyladenosine modification protein [Porphyromonas macacae]SUB88187.1 tRNA(ANN) t(6)A37 threonylcarbamoyladenosine modification protein [Porphyromonas macacae]
MTYICRPNSNLLFFKMKSKTQWDDKTEQSLREAVETMRRGGIILYPTDTVWGIGCDATNKEAVEKIYKLKRRSDSKSMLILTDSEAKLPGLVSELPEIAYDLIDVSVRPLTVIYSGARNIAPNLIAEDGSVGIRISREAWSKELCKRMNVPVVSTSANISGEPTPHFFDQISDAIKKGVDYIADYRRDDRTPANPSEIIKLGPKGEVTIIRK